MADRTTDRLEYLRSRIQAERISQGEILELQDFAKMGDIQEGDVELLQWAGVPEAISNGLKYNDAFKLVTALQDLITGAMDYRDEIETPTRENSINNACNVLADLGIE